MSTQEPHAGTEPPAEVGDSQGQSGASQVGRDVRWLGSEWRACSQHKAAGAAPFCWAVIVLPVQWTNNGPSDGCRHSVALNPDGILAVRGK